MPDTEINKAYRNRIDRENRPGRGPDKKKEPYQYKPHPRFGKFLYFYLNGKLYKMLKLQRLVDEAYVFNYTDCEYNWLSWSYIKKNAGAALSRKQFIGLTGRNLRSLRVYIEEGYISQPDYTYKIPGPRPEFDPSKAGVWPRDPEYWKKPFRFRYKEEDLYALIEHLNSLPKTKTQRKKTRTVSEAKLMLDHGILLKAVLPDGREVQMWEAPPLT